MVSQVQERGDFELLSGLLQGSRQERLRKASEVLERVGGLSNLRTYGRYEELGFSAQEASRLATAFELGARALIPPARAAPLLTSADAFVFLLPLFLGAERERFYVVVLDSKHRPRSRWLVAEGSAQECRVDVREVFRPALRDGGAGIVVAHNHPSGDPTPSRADLVVTERLRLVGELVGMPLVDHLVVGAPEPGTGRAAYVSLRDARLLRAPRRARGSRVGG